MNATPVDQLRQRHPDQARIDAESARLLLSSTRHSGGSRSWARPELAVGTNQSRPGDADRSGIVNRRP
jgi:hypothetical protein